MNHIDEMTAALFDSIEKVESGEMTAKEHRAFMKKVNQKLAEVKKQMKDGITIDFFERN